MHGTIGGDVTVLHVCDSHIYMTSIIWLECKEGNECMLTPTILACAS